MTAKVAAGTAVLQGISAEAFEEHYWPTCRHISRDNAIGRSIFIFTQLIQRWRFTKRGILRMVRNEQGRQGVSRRMSEVLWDTFTGSATYGDIARRSISPAFLGGLAWNTLVSLPGRRERA